MGDLLQLTKRKEMKYVDADIDLIMVDANYNPYKHRWENILHGGLVYNGAYDFDFETKTQYLTIYPHNEVIRPFQPTGNEIHFKYTK